MKNAKKAKKIPELGVKTNGFRSLRFSQLTLVLFSAVPPLLIFFHMKSEDYLEITNRINDIKTLIEKKHPHPDTLHYNYKRIIEERDDKAAYLSKQSPTLEVLRRLPNSSSNHREREQLITESRTKIKRFHNEFEELEQCLQNKNKLRAKKVREEEFLYMERLAKRILAKEQPEEQRENESDSYSRPEPSRREGVAGTTTSHPFQGAKAEKFLEIYKDYLRKHKQDPKHKFRFPGVGFECTPLYQLLKTKKK